MTTNLPRHHSRRRGPGLIATVAVLLVLIVQGGLFALFQWINSQGRTVQDEPVLEAVTQVEEREIIAPENAPETIPGGEAPLTVTDPDPDPETVAAPEKREEPVVAAGSEADMLQLLDQIKKTQPEATPKAVDPDVRDLDIASALFGKDTAAARSAPLKPPVKQPESRPAVRPVKTERVPPVSARKIRVVSVEQNRFPSNDASDEMRVLNISIAMGANAGDVFGDYVGIKVTFYDEVGDTGMAMPSRVQTSTNPIRLAKRAWRPDANYLVTATYLVPKGFRTQYQKKTGARTKYYGYIIELYYKDQLQDVYAQPKTLLPSDR